MSRAAAGSIVLDGRRIGGGARCFVIAEAGVNHDGDEAVAHHLVDAAADAGADAVKFQTFDPDALASADAPKAEYQVKNTGSSESQRDMLRRLVLSREAHNRLQKHAKDRGITFLSTPFDEGSADFLAGIGVCALKVPSGEVTNHPFLAHLARKKLPMLMSTGMCELEEVAAALDVLIAEGAPALALFHCTSSYPAPPDSINLRAMATLRARFGVPVGYSDHSLGLPVPFAAVALGAELIEKHLTLDRNRQGPDHAASMEPAELAAMLQGIRAIEAGLGDGRKVPHASELDTRRVARRSLFAARDIALGAPIGPTDLVARRPATGISPSMQRSIIGRRARRAIVAGTLLSEGDLE